MKQSASRQIPTANAIPSRRGLLRWFAAGLFGCFLPGKGRAASPPLVPAAGPAAGEPSSASSVSEASGTMTIYAPLPPGAAVYWGAVPAETFEIKRVE